jgi:hypothetical protein
MVAIDGSEYSLKAAEYAQAITKSFAAQLYAFSKKQSSLVAVAHTYIGSSQRPSTARVCGEEEYKFDYSRIYYFTHLTLLKYEIREYHMPGYQCL